MKLRKEFDSMEKSVFQMINTGVLQLKDQKYFDIGEFLVRPIL